MERIVIGIVEFVAAVLLIITATAWLGAGLALRLMLGAILMHLTIPGIIVVDDGGYCFYWRWRPQFVTFPVFTTIGK